MNFSDSEIVASIMTENNYETTSELKNADIILVNTCSIRENAEQKVFNRLKEFKSHKKHKPGLKIGILGCMAERLKTRLIEDEKLVDMVVGPDSYRELPRLLNSVEQTGHQAINVILSAEETYDDIEPVRIGSNGVSAFISIMRGCQNFCTYCVVPYTRGIERSRNPLTIVKEAQSLFNQGYREITLLGQNVNSYRWNYTATTYKSFPDLLSEIAQISPLLRLRFATSHPKDISDKLIETIASFPNICNSIHLPVQSGSNEVLRKMNRKYTRENYMEKISKIRKLIPDCALSTDLIAGFCGETEADHLETLSLMKWVGYDFAYMFKYSERPNTAAAENFEDDIPDGIKGKRLEEIIQLQQELSLQSNTKDIGKIFEVLVESTSRRSKEKLSGRNTQNKVVVFPKKNHQIGDYVRVKVTSCTAATLMGEAI